MSDIKTIYLEGPVAWAKVQKPVPTRNGDKLEYTLDIAISEEKFQELLDLGMSSLTKHKEKEDGLKYITLRRPTHSKAGNEMLPLEIVDKDAQPFTGLIGNGSICSVGVSLIPYSGKFGEGVKLILSGLQILELVEYTPEKKSLFVPVSSDTVAANDNEDLF